MIRMLVLHVYRSQLNAASAAIRVFQAHQRMEALQKEEVSASGCASL